MSPARRKCQKCGRNRAERFYTSKRGRTCNTCRRRARSDTAHETRVQATYGLRPGEYTMLMEFQGGRCAICRQVRTKRLSVDHDHTTGVVRGLLCQRCNNQLLAVGAQDSPEILRAAYDYLMDPPAVRCIGERYHRRDGDPGRGQGL